MPVVSPRSVQSPKSIQSPKPVLSPNPKVQTLEEKKQFNPWNHWNVKAADRAIDEERARKLSASIPSGSMIIRETYKPATVDADGNRTIGKAEHRVLTADEDENNPVESKDAILSMEAIPFREDAPTKDDISAKDNALVKEEVSVKDGSQSKDDVRVNESAPLSSEDAKVSFPLTFMNALNRSICLNNG